MDISEIRQKIDANREKLASFRGSLWPRRFRGRDCHFGKQNDRTDFWNDNIAAQKTSQELNELKNTYNTFHKMDELQDEVEILLDFLAEDESVMDELVEKLDELDQMMTSYEMTLLLSEPYDHNNAILEIHPGSGGTEAQDWGDMLLRMYTRYGMPKASRLKVLDYQAVMRQESSQ